MPTLAEIRQQYPQYDDMSDSQLADAMYRKFYSDMDRSTFDQKIGFGKAPTAETPQEPPGKIAPFDYPSHYKQMVAESTGMMGEGVERLKKGGLADIAVGAGKTALGGLGYLTSPINAAIRTTVGQPLEAVGIPKEYSEFAASLALPLPKRIPLQARGAERAADRIPTIEEAKASYLASLEDPAVAAAQIKPEDANRIVAGIKARLESAQFDPQSPVFRELSRLERAVTPVDPRRAQFDPTYVHTPTPPVSMYDFDLIRRNLSEMSRGIPTPETVMAGRAAKGVDEALGNISQSEAAAGDVAEAQRILGAGRADYRGAKVAEALDKRLHRAELQTEATHSGMNLQNKLRQSVEQFLAGPDARGIKQADRDMLESFVRGTATENTMRFVSNLLGGGGGLGMLASGGVAGAVAGLPGLAAPAAGLGLKYLGNVLTAKQAEKLSDLFLSQTPLAKQMRGPITDWNKAAQEFEISPTARNMSRLAIASRNLSHNLEDVDIELTPNEIVKAAYNAITPQGEQ